MKKGWPNNIQPITKANLPFRAQNRRKQKQKQNCLKVLCNSSTNPYLLNHKRLWTSNLVSVSHLLSPLHCKDVMTYRFTAVGWRRNDAGPCWHSCRADNPPKGFHPSQASSSYTGETSDRLPNLKLLKYTASWLNKPGHLLIGLTFTLSNISAQKSQNLNPQF